MLRTEHRHANTILRNLSEGINFAEIRSALPTFKISQAEEEVEVRKLYRNREARELGKQQPAPSVKTAA